MKTRRSRNLQVKRLLSELASIRMDIAALSERLNATLSSIPKPPADATAAAAARAAGRLRGFYWVGEFSALLGRHKQFVSDRCAARVIRTLRGGKPYRIPLDEEFRWN